MVLGVNAWDEAKPDVAKFVEEHKLKHRILLDGSKVGERYELLGIPTLFWIDAEGVMVDIEVGFDSPESVERRTKRLLAAKE